MKKLFSILILLALFSCETKEAKLNKARETVMSFITNMSFDNYDLMYKTYPLFSEVRSYWKLKDFQIISTELNENSINVFGRSQEKEVLFELERIDGKYIIKRSKGLSSDYNSSLYKYCKKIGCLGLNNYDSDVSRVCEDKEIEFNILVNSIKETIENSVRIENHNVSISFGSASGQITYKNNSRFTIPGFAYEVYVNYLNSQGTPIFTAKEISNYESIPYGQSKTIFIFNNSDSFQKIGISLKIINNKFIEDTIAEYAEGSNCQYQNNL